jgi:hypothetical protein
MEPWTLARCEPTFEELLADEMMGAVTRSAGTDRARLRALMREVAGRVPAERIAAFRPRCAPPASSGCRPSAA